jgi:dolichol kinase
MVDWQPFIDFCLKYELMFIIWVQVIFGLLGIGIFYYAFTSRKNPAKQGHPEYFINEFIVGVLFFLAIFTYPFIFNQYLPSAAVRAQVYFHIWDSITVNFICYGTHVLIGNYRKKKKGLKFTREEFNTQFCKDYDDSLWADLQRKWLHALPPVLGLVLLLIARYFEPFLESQGWTSELLVVFMIFSVGIHFLVILTEADLQRFLAMNSLTLFAVEWMSHALRPKELETPTSATIMVLSQLVFLFAPFPVFFTVIWITALSDATASLVGKSFNKLGWAKHKIGNSPKTYAGLIGGCLMTFIIPFLINWLIPFEGASLLLILGMAIAATTAFAFIDVFAKRISDNFLNPMVCGGLIWILYLLF